MFSRVVFGARISLLIGLVGIAASLFLGLLLGGLAGYYGGWVDSAIQRLIEILRSFPELPLWMALSAVLPVTWSPILVFFGITLILALLDWTGLGTRRAQQIIGVTRRRLLRRRPPHGRPPKTHHRTPPATRFRQPHHRLGNPLHPRHDPRRNRPVVPRTRLGARQSPVGACC